MLEEAVTHKSDDVFPVVVTFVSDFLLQHRADGNHRGESVSKDHELQKEFPAENAERCGENNGCDANDLHNRRKQFKEPQIGKRKTADSAVTRAKEHVAVGPQHVQQAFLPACTLSSERAEIRRN